MGKSLTLGSLFGICIKVHWSFSLIIAFWLFASLISGSSLLGALASVGFVLVLFGCVVLHELGHALAARYFGIATRDITLLPIGGVARLERMPRQPLQELVVALAGPAVNVVIAGVLFAFLLPTAGLGNLIAAPLGGGGFLQQLMFVNVALVLFNMLPAFPLDGGRVLRALLATFMSYARATSFAAAVGQFSAIGLGLLGFANPFLFVIAVFVFLGARAEAAQVALQEQLGDSRVSDGMIRNFRAMSADAPVQVVAPRLLDSTQRDFPVIHDNTYVGMLRRYELLAALETGIDATVGEVAKRDVQTLDAAAPLVTAVEKAPAHSGEWLPVVESGELIGLVNPREAAERAKAKDLLLSASRLANTPVSTHPTSHVT